MKSVQTNISILVHYWFDSCSYIFRLYPKCPTAEQRKVFYFLFFLARISQYPSETMGWWIHVSLIPWLARPVRFYGYGVEIDIFSWRYPNEHFRVLLWVRSLMKELEHLASRHLSVEIRWKKVSIACHSSMPSNKTECQLYVKSCQEYWCPD